MPLIEKMQPAFVCGDKSQNFRYTWYRNIFP